MAFAAPRCRCRYVAHTRDAAMPRLFSLSGLRFHYFAIFAGFSPLSLIDFFASLLTPLHRRFASRHAFAAAFFSFA
jgi:hypothetical protein